MTDKQTFEAFITSMLNWHPPPMPPREEGGYKEYAVWLAWEAWKESKKYDSD